VVAALRKARVRFVVIGVAGAYYARTASALVRTWDTELLLPTDARNALRAWRALEVGDEPVDRPRDLRLARAICERRALVRARGRGLEIDLSLVMGSFRFARVYEARRHFVVDGVRIPVADLRHIVRSKAEAGRPKDRLFLATHSEALKGVLARPLGRRGSATRRPK
jgi:hypothetical protein